MRGLLIAALLTLLPAGTNSVHEAQKSKLIGAGGIIAVQSGQGTQHNLSGARETVSWETGLSSPSPKRLEELKSKIRTAKEQNLEVLLTLTPDWLSIKTATPVTETARQQFCDYAANLALALPEVRLFEIGNEPNNNHFWWHQFSTRGRSLAPKAYTRLLARCYDTLKAAALIRGFPVTVIGGALASRGSDNPFSKKATHSVCSFLRGMGKELQRLERLGRERPVMDVFSVHPYGTVNTEPPSHRHKACVIGFADYGKLRRVMSQAFGDTVQSPDVPVVYSEYAVQTTTPVHEVGYNGQENLVGVNELTQGKYYRQAIRFAVCQSGVIGLFFLHQTDEPDLRRWQGGLQYLDGSEKSSAAIVRQATVKVQHGNMECG